MLTKTTKKSSNQNPLLNQARSSVLQQKVTIRDDKPLQQPIWQPGFAAENSMPRSIANTGHNFARIPVLQPKLTIGQPNDRYEQEADRVADQVMRMPAGAVPTNRQQSQPGLIQRTCATCANEYDAAAEEERPVEQENLCPQCRLQAKPRVDQITPLLQREAGNTLEEEDEEKTTLQTKPLMQRQAEEEEEEEEKEGQPLQTSAAAGQTPAVRPGIAASINAMQGGGQALSAATRGFMEPRFGRDFSQVRVHSDPNAARISRQINARAFTFGRHIAFGGGQYQPNTPVGKQLLAHELTHTIQQTGTVQRQGGKSPKPKPKNVYEDCTSSQKSAIGTSFTSALGFVNNAVSALNTAYGSHPKISAHVKTMLKRHFHTTKKKDIGKILSKFRDIQNAMSRGINFECETDCDPGTGGYVWRFLFWHVGDIHICFNLFNKLSALQRDETIIHEVAHRHAGVADKAYHWQSKYNKLSAKEAMNNADSYAVFARRL